MATNSILDTITSMTAPEKEIVRVYFDELVKSFTKFGTKYNLFRPNEDESEIRRIVLKVWEAGILRTTKDSDGMLQWEIRDDENNTWILVPTFGR